ncbi:MAG: DUF1638 domain-containing protein [Proteobacteria bacterium]|nr:DUF1638 domain-containing protein [Pseudomonadota bacterium]
MTPEKRLPIVVIACRVLQDMFEPLVSKDLHVKTQYMDYGLHRVPKKMTHVLQAELDQIKEPSLVVLGYGLCGNGLDGIEAGPHTLLIPRTDDCIALLLGSYEAYIREFQSVPGTFYLSKGWIECGSHPLKEYERLVEEYGEKEADWLMDAQYKNYERLCFVAHNDADLKRYRPQAYEVARFCERWNFRYEELSGSDEYIRQLLSVTTDLSKADGNFVVVHPGETVLQRFFIRS